MDCNFTTYPYPIPYPSPDSIHLEEDDISYSPLNQQRNTPSNTNISQPTYNSTDAYILPFQSIPDYTNFPDYPPQSTQLSYIDIQAFFSNLVYVGPPTIQKSDVPVLSSPPPSPQQQQQHRQQEQGHAQEQQTFKPIINQRDEKIPKFSQQWNGSNFGILRTGGTTIPRCKQFKVYTPLAPPTEVHKIIRVSKACENCHKTKRKCSDSVPCRRCTQNHRQCVRSPVEDKKKKYFQIAVESKKIKDHKKNKTVKNADICKLLTF